MTTTDNPDEVPLATSVVGHGDKVENLTSSLLRYTPPPPHPQASTPKGPLHPLSRLRMEKANELLGKGEAMKQAFQSFRSWFTLNGSHPIFTLLLLSALGKVFCVLCPADSSCNGWSKSMDEDYQDVPSMSYLNSSSSAESEHHDPDKSLLTDEL